MLKPGEMPPLDWRRPVRTTARLPIKAYRYTLSMLAGRTCRHMPSCSEFGDEAIGRHGLWAGGWMTAARVCRCHPWGTSGFDPVPENRNATAAWWRPWRYGTWGRKAPRCERVP